MGALIFFSYIKVFMDFTLLNSKKISIYSIQLAMVDTFINFLALREIRNHGDKNTCHAYGIFLCFAEIVCVMFALFTELCSLLTLHAMGCRCEDILCLKTFSYFFMACFFACVSIGYNFFLICINF